MEIHLLLQQIRSASSIKQQDELKGSLAAAVNHLLLNDFPALVQLLYRIDVSEEKLKQTLKANAGIDAGLLIAEMIIDREKQKAAWRKQQNGK